MLLLLLFVLGISVGSFLNVLIDRIPREESFLKGRSYCEKCKKELSFFDLIPLLSFVMLKGKCRYCHSPISFYYPLVEVTTGVLFVLTFLNIESRIMNQAFLTPNFSLLTSISQLSSFIYQLVIFSSLIVIFFTDLKYGIIPDKILFPAIIIVFLFIISQSLSILISNLLSAFGAFLFFFLLFLVTKGKGMGFGDVKYVFFMGLFLGFPKVAIGLYISFLTGAFISLILIVLRKKRFKGSTVPFGPFLVFGTVIAFFLGDAIWKIIFS